MVEFDIPKDKSSIIKVIGVGGGGSNAVNYMHEQQIEGVDFIICNTDAKALNQSSIANKIQLGPHLTQGLGAGANPQVGKQATEESLDEIQKILEVNTKMAFICAGMGGGTGTGGAPIIAKICQKLGILTVGIVTTPFSFEGPRRFKQAEDGIKELEPYVDTLLVINNDKMRMQYGNLKMKEAFGKADNVLATAAKCITDIINSQGHIIVDFNDVCTVMKNGGVAILGSSTVEGDDRAQVAIEEALNSPLLNDNDIHGAKWILLNVNTSEGEYECTMDEFEQINNYVREQAGEETDVIAGIGFDNTLERGMSITLIATGFEHKDPFNPEIQDALKNKKNEDARIVVELKDHQSVTPTIQPLDSDTNDSVAAAETPSVEDSKENVVKNDLMPFVADNSAQVEQKNILDDETPVTFELKPEIHDADSTPYINFDENLEDKKPVSGQGSAYVMPQSNTNFGNTAQPNSSIFTSHPANNNPQGLNSHEDRDTTSKNAAYSPFKSEEEEVHFDVSYTNANYHDHSTNVFIDQNDLEETEEERKRKLAQERIKKLRELSFNVSNDPNSEYDAVPAYMRKNWDMFGEHSQDHSDISSPEKYYSKYQVKKEDDNQASISSLNKFLDGKKPD